MDKTTNIEVVGEGIEEHWKFAYKMTASIFGGLLLIFCLCLWMFSDIFIKKQVPIINTMTEEQSSTSILLSEIKILKKQTNLNRTEINSCEQNLSLIIKKIQKNNTKIENVLKWQNILRGIIELQLLDKKK